MDDTNTFERHLAAGLDRLAGPPRPVDALAIARAVTTDSSPRGFTIMVSVLKFVAAAAIVALFGGFLLAGMFTTQQGDEVLPAAVTESPSPMTTEGLLPGVTLTVEGIGPGVYRVINDGVRDLMSVEAVDIVAGYDGGIWLLREDEFLRLGSDGSHGWPMGSGPEDHIFEVAPDGTMWVIPGPYPVSPLNRGAGQHSTDGEEWTVQPCPAEYCAGFTVAPDGTVWASWREHFTVSDPPPGPGGQWRVGHLGPTGWQPLAGYAREDPLPWDDEGFSTKGYRRLFITDTGDLYGFNLANEGLFRYEGSDWESFSPTGFDNLDVGPDGTVWYDAGEEGVREDLYRFAGGEWTRWTPDDLPDIGFGTVTDSQFEVAPDGSLWSGLRRCDGLARFDGETIEPFLPGQCIWLDIAADGSVWVLAGDETLQVFSNEERKWVFADDPTSDLYVITPEAVASSE